MNNEQSQVGTETNESAPEVVTTDAAHDAIADAPSATDSASDSAPSVSGTTVSNLREDEPQIEGRIGLDEPLVQDGMQWFVLRVASNKENSVQQTLLRKIQIENMTHLVGRILVPTEKINPIVAAH